MMSQPGKKTFATHPFPNMSRSKGNQAMKVGQLIECNIRNIFIETLYTKCGGETIPWSLCKKSKLSISLDQLCKSLNNYFPLYAKLRAIKIKWNQAADHLLLPNIKLLKKQKSSVWPVSLPYFLHNFKEKYFSLDVVLTD